MGELRFSS